MGLLDDLKQQAAARRQEQQTSEATRERHRKEVHAVLAEAARYLTELADSLNVLKPDVARQYYIGQARLDGLHQREYNARDRRVSVDGQDYVEETSLAFRCVGDRPLKIERSSPDAVQKQSDFLWGYGFRFDCQEIRNDRMMLERAVFTVLPEVQASAAFVGDLESGQVRLTLRNIETAGNVDYIYQPAEVNGDLLEELTKLLLTQPNKLRRLGYYQEIMSTSTRMAFPSSPQQDSPPAGPRPHPAGGSGTK